MEKVRKRKRDYITLNGERLWSITGLAREMGVSPTCVNRTALERVEVENEGVWFRIKEGWSLQVRLSLERIKLFDDENNAIKEEIEKYVE